MSQESLFCLLSTGIMIFTLESFPYGHLSHPRLIHSQCLTWMQSSYSMYMTQMNLHYENSDSCDGKDINKPVAWPISAYGGLIFHPTTLQHPFVNRTTPKPMQQSCPTI